MHTIHAMVSIRRQYIASHDTGTATMVPLTSPNVITYPVTFQLWKYLLKVFRAQSCPVTTFTWYGFLTGAMAVIYWHCLLHVLMRDERRKEERSKQGQTNNKAKQHSTPKAVHIHLGCAVLLCLVCLFDLACFFLSSFSSLI